MTINHARVRLSNAIHSVAGSVSEAIDSAAEMASRLLFSPLHRLAGAVRGCGCPEQCAFLCYADMFRGGSHSRRPCACPCHEVDP